ncbi:MAG: dienelactone hydrolase [Verrucomicrobiota bacterium]
MRLLILNGALRVWLVMGGLVLAVLPARAGYDPLAVAAVLPEGVDMTLRDTNRLRDIPLRVYLPTNPAPGPVVLFSHGLGGSREGSSFLGRHWAARGYVAVFLQHPGSDESVWKNIPPAERMAAMERAASASNFLLRVQDVQAVITGLAVWNRTAGNPLIGRLDMNRLGMSGHSFGAVTTEAVSGESFGLARQRFTDHRIRAAMVFSPSVPKAGRPEAAFHAVEIPWMLMTGTEDVAPIGHETAASRLEVYPYLKGEKYELVLFGAEHSVFTDRPLPGDHERRDPNHHRVILALSTAFWDACLRDDAAAREWLQGKGPSKLLDPKDRWQWDAGGRAGAAAEPGKH